MFNTLLEDFTVFNFVLNIWSILESWIFLAPVGEEESFVPKVPGLGFKRLGFKVVCFLWMVFQVFIS